MAIPKSSSVSASHVRWCSQCWLSSFLSGGAPGFEMGFEPFPVLLLLSVQVCPLIFVVFVLQEGTDEGLG